MTTIMMIMGYYGISCHFMFLIWHVHVFVLITLSHFLCPTTSASLSTMLVASRYVSSAIPNQHCPQLATLNLKPYLTEPEAFPGWLIGGTQMWWPFQSSNQQTQGFGDPGWTLLPNIELNVHNSDEQSRKPEDALPGLLLAIISQYQPCLHIIHHC